MFVERSEQMLAHLRLRARQYREYVDGYTMGFAAGTGDRGRRKITADWWKRCLTDPEKLEHWLVSLHNNERDAEARFREFAHTYCQGDQSAHATMLSIAEQEKTHAELVASVLGKRGIKLHEWSSADGRYWRNVLPCAIDARTAAAVGAYSAPCFSGIQALGQ